MKKTIAVLGAGMVGRAIALDLAIDNDVTAFDLNAQNLLAIKEANPAIQTVAADLSRFNDYENWFAPFDFIVTAVPGFMGFKTLEAVIKAGKNVVDISFFPEDALQFDVLAKSKDVTVITDCGVAPGLSNLILGRYNEEMKIESFECYVGGLPVERTLPFQYKAPFSPVDVIQEYIRPARLVENGNIGTKPALSEKQLVHIDEIGELEAFNTDGLRSLVTTMSHIPNMKEKTMRYPGHADLIESLQQAGFFDTTALRFGETDITPLDFTSRLLVNQWKLQPGDEEFTAMKIIIKGDKGAVEYDLLDRYDTATQTSSMARTTGYTCTAALNLLSNGLFASKGLFPPELIGKDKACFDFVLEYLAKRNVNLRVKKDF